MQQISTGYKPEFGLGAVYQGINAADAEGLNQEELIKAYLANQREQQAMPLDMDIKGLQAAQARQQNNPNMLEMFRGNQEAGYQKNIRENEIGGVLQPFLKEKASNDGQAQVNVAKLNNNLLELQNTISTGKDRNGNVLSPQDLQILDQEYQKQVGLRGTTPELFGKMAIEDNKGQWDLDKQRLANEGHLDSANVTANNNKHTELTTAFTVVSREISNINTNISKIESKQIENQVIQDLLRQGRKLQDAEKEAKTKVNAFKSQLLAEKAQLQAQQNYIMSQIPSLKDYKPSSGVINLD